MGLNSLTDLLLEPTIYCLIKDFLALYKFAELIFPAYKIYYAHYTTFKMGGPQLAEFLSNHASSFLLKSGSLFNPYCLLGSPYLDYGVPIFFFLYVANFHESTPVLPQFLLSSLSLHFHPAGTCICFVLCFTSFPKGSWEY